MMIKMLFFVKINLSICCEEQLFDLFKDRVSVFILALVETWRYLGFSMVMLSQRFSFKFGMLVYMSNPSRSIKPRQAVLTK